MEIMSAETSIAKNHDAKNQQLPSLCQPYPLPTPWTLGAVGDGRTLIYVEGLAWHGGNLKHLLCQYPSQGGRDHNCIFPPN